MFYIVTYLCTLVILANAAVHLPSYIKPCRRSDPKFNECAKKSAIEAIPHIVHGDKAYKIPSLSPLHLSLIEIQASENLKLSLKNLDVFGLDKMVLEDMKFDFENRNIDVTVSSPYMYLIGEYKIDGQILILPIVGSGPANLTFVNSVFHYTTHYDLVKGKDGKDYLANFNPSITYTIEKPIYRFDNLFNGDKRLGEEMNRFLNENANDVHKDLSPAVSQTMSTVVTSILGAFLPKFPYDEVFLP